MGPRPSVTLALYFIKGFAAGARLGGEIAGPLLFIGSKTGFGGIISGGLVGATKLWVSREADNELDSWTTSSATNSILPENVASLE